jgi:DNA modification methylase
MPQRDSNQEGTPPHPAPPRARKPSRRCNQLPGKTWLRNSISVWSDIQKSPEERALKHPALFPCQLVDRLVETFLPGPGALVLDPFAGVGSTLVAAARSGSRAVGCELSPEFTAVIERRVAELTPEEQARITLVNQSAFDLPTLVAPGSVDLCVTSPPYWNILNQKRTADYKSVRHYGNLADDLGTIADYDEFLDRLGDLFRLVFETLRPGAYCCVVVMDLRKKNKFYPFHSDLAARLEAIGFEWDDLVIWNRQAEYNNLRPLGYPAVFRVNKVHEYVLIFQKRTAPAGRKD